MFHYLSNPNCKSVQERVFFGEKQRFVA